MTRPEVILFSDLPPDIRLRIEREMRYARTRQVEVWLSRIMVATGLALLAPGETFSLPVYDFIQQFAAEEWAGMLGLVTGVARLQALRINGSGRRTPLARVAGAVGGWLFWAGISLGVLFSTTGTVPIGLGLAVFPFLALAELQASGVAGGDIVSLDSFGTRERRRQREPRSQSR